MGLEPIPGDLIPIKLAAEVAGCNLATIYDWIHTSKIPAWGRKQKYRVSLASIMPPVRPAGSRKRTKAPKKLEAWRDRQLNLPIDTHT
jgi:hypothetical protein